MTALARIRSASTLATCALLYLPTGSRGGEAPGALDREYEAMVARLEARFSEIPSEENAATHYLKAVAALPDTPSDDDPEVEPSALDEFVGNELISLPPDAVTAIPGAVDRLRAYAPAVAHLRRGAGLGRCAFKLDWRAGTGMLLPHLAQMRDLARRATCYGKLLEHEKRPREAARVYLDVVRMGVHLDQDPMLLHALVGIACTGMVAPSIEGLLARGVDAETARLLLDGLRTLPRPAFNAARSVEAERVWHGRNTQRTALAQSSDAAKNAEARKKLKGMLGAGPGGHKEWDIPEDPKEIAHLLNEAFTVYDGHMKLLVETMRRPYHKARPQVERLAAMQKSYWDGVVKAGRFAAGWVNLIRAPVTAVFVRVTRCEARLRGLQILAAAALARADTGEYPATVRDLAKRFPRGVPRDPFTGGNFSYWLPDGLPAVACKADDPEIERKRPEMYHFGLAYRLTLEKQDLAEWRERREKRR